MDRMDGQRESLDLGTANEPHVIPTRDDVRRILVPILGRFFQEALARNLARELGVDFPQGGGTGEKDGKDEKDEKGEGERMDKMDEMDGMDKMDRMHKKERRE